MTDQTRHVVIDILLQVPYSQDQRKPEMTNGLAGAKVDLRGTQPLFQIEIDFNRVTRKSIHHRSSNSIEKIIGRNQKVPFSFFLRMGAARSST